MKYAIIVLLPEIAQNIAQSIAENIACRNGETLLTQGG
jgi:hypothetical protein